MSGQRKATGLPHIRAAERRAPADPRATLARPIHDLRFTILLLQLIGSDRSAFAAGRHKVAGQSKTKESCVCSIHDEGLLEHPIKN